MGNKQAKIDIKPKELKELREMTKCNSKELIWSLVSDDEIYVLYNSFKSASSSRIDDGVIDEQLGELGIWWSFRELRSLVGMKEGFFFERLFSMFDKNNDGQIVFTEFLRCISFMTSRMPPDERLHCMKWGPVLFFRSLPFLWSKARQRDFPRRTKADYRGHVLPISTEH